MAASSIYCIDTSSILVWFVDTYPPSIFPKIPERIEGLIASGRMRAPKAVADEIFAKTDECSRWTKTQSGLFVEESAAVQLGVKKLLATHANPLKPQKGINGADPFVIAMAQAGGSTWTVVSDEHPGSLENRKIPFVCNAEGIRCISFKAMMLAEGWTFV